MFHVKFATKRGRVRMEAFTVIFPNGHIRDIDALRTWQPKLYAQVRQQLREEYQRDGQRQ